MAEDRHGWLSLCHSTCQTLQKDDECCFSMVCLCWKREQNGRSVQACMGVWQHSMWYKNAYMCVGLSYPALPVGMQPLQLIVRQLWERHLCPQHTDISDHTQKHAKCTGRVPLWWHGNGPGQEQPSGDIFQLEELVRKSRDLIKTVHHPFIINLHPWLKLTN